MSVAEFCTLGEMKEGKDIGMKKIVIYGVACIELRQDIEKFLDDDYQIIGYSDAYFTSSGIDGVPFIKLCELCNHDFDYVLPASYQENTRMSMRQSLIENGVLEEKIIEPTMFLQRNAEKARFDIIEDIRNNYKGGYGLIFGLSYSRFGIRKNLLTKYFYDCSLPGLDLYYNFHIYMYMVNQGLLSDTKTALMVFPYYYFNYDMSRALAQYTSGQIFSVYQLDDWHHYQQVSGGINYVTNYRMFGKKIAKAYCSHCVDIEKSTVYQGGDGMAVLDKIWLTEHKETIKENRTVFLEFCFNLKERAITPILVVPPLYLQGLDSASVEAFKQKKKQFYRIVDETEKSVGKIKIFDYADKFAKQPELFRDITHLNTTGGKVFTGLINEDILSE